MITPKFEPGCKRNWACPLAGRQNCCCHSCRWFKSHPEDIGNTTVQAFDVSPEPGISIAAQMTNAAADFNVPSKSNGALMRIAPLAIFGCYMPVETLAELAKQDARLSHPSNVCQSCNAVYCTAVAHLITHPGDGTGAIEAATAMATNPSCDPEVRQWLVEDSLGQPEDVQADHMDMHMIGFCRWGFTLAFMWLRKGSKYVLRSMYLSLIHI